MPLRSFQHTPHIGHNIPLNLYPIHRQIQIYIYMKKNAELQSKHNLILHVKLLNIFLKYGYAKNIILNNTT